MKLKIQYVLSKLKAFLFGTKKRSLLTAFIVIALIAVGVFAYTRYLKYKQDQAIEAFAQGIKEGIEKDLGGLTLEEYRAKLNEKYPNFKGLGYETLVPKYTDLSKLTGKQDYISKYLNVVNDKASSFTGVAHYRNLEMPLLKGWYEINPKQGTVESSLYKGAGVNLNSSETPAPLLVYHPATSAYTLDAQTIEADDYTFSTLLKGRPPEEKCKYAADQEMGLLPDSPITFTVSYDYKFKELADHYQCEFLYMQKFSMGPNITTEVIYFSKTNPDSFIKLKTTIPLDEPLGAEMAQMIQNIKFIK